MYILIQNLLAIAFLGNIAIILSFVISLYIRRDILIKNNFPRLLTSIFLILFLLAVCVFQLFCFNSEELTVKFGIFLLILEIFISLAFFWFFSYLHGIESNSLEILKAVVGVIEAGDPNLDGHSLHVQKLTMLMYNYLPWRYRLMINPYNLKYASLLLDVGKLGVPRRIVAKAGKLEREEWEMMRRHPVIGLKILSPVASCAPILLWIKYHHERMDGGGYYHLEGKEIPLASRIIAIADTYSAITMERSYRASFSYEEAISAIKLVAGSQLDPELVKIFCSIPLRKIEACLSEVQKEMARYDEENFR